MAKYSPAQTKAALRFLLKWTSKGSTITRIFQFLYFAKTIELINFNGLQKNPASPWADYVKGVLEQLRKRGVLFSGFTAAIAGDIPIGAGMSSSAALEVATALTVRRLYPFSLTQTSTAQPPN